MAKTKSVKKTKETVEKKTRKRTDPEVISKALLQYSAARASVDEAVYSINNLNNDSEAHDVLSASGNIRSAFNAIRTARDTFKDMSKNSWVRTMFEHLTDWEERVDEHWEKIQSFVE